MSGTSSPTVKTHSVILSEEKIFNLSVKDDRWSSLRFSRVPTENKAKKIYYPPKWWVVIFLIISVLFFINVYNIYADNKKH